MLDATAVVLYNGNVVGVASRAALRPVVAERGAKVIDTVDRWMTTFPRQGPRPVVSADAPLDEVRRVAAANGGVAVVLATARGAAGEEVCVGIATQADLDAAAA